MTRSWAEIVATIALRRSNDSQLVRQMQEIGRRYNADYVIPNPTVQGEPILPPLTPSIIAEAIDYTAMGAASVVPDVQCPPLDPSNPTGRRSVAWADIRRDVILDDWRESRLKVLLRRGYRQLAGYATTCLVVLPNFDTQRARISLRDPLGAYPDARGAEEIRPPENIGFVYGRSFAWIKHNLVDPDIDQARRGDAQQWFNTQQASRGGDRNETLYDLIEWIDRDEIVVGVAGPRHAQSRWETAADGGVELRRWPNRAGVVPVVCPARVSMDRIASQVAHIVGTVDLMAKLMGLEVMAAEKAIFPDRYIIGRDDATPRLVGSRWKDGREGEVNLIIDADKIGELQSMPGPATMPTIDRLERNASVSSGRVPQFGGETYGALRTGRGIDALLGASTDPRVQELQETMEAHLPWLNEAILATYEGYWPEQKYTHIPGVTFVPATHIETRKNDVAYPIIGADLQGTTVALAQLVGAGLMSDETAMERHPYIRDARMEKQRKYAAKLDEALFASILQRASQGGMDPTDVAALKREVLGGAPIEEAWQTVQRAAQERQAQQAPPPPPGMAVAPETQPGLAGPGDGATMQPPPEQQQGPGPTDQLRGVQDLISALNARPRVA